MRKVISIMMVLVLGVAVMGTSAYAECPGPKTPSATIRHGDPTPGGDDHGFDPPFESPGRPEGPAGGAFILPCYGSATHQWFVDLVVIAVVGANPEGREAIRCTQVSAKPAN